ncbi:MAG: hypothetical protein HQK73_04625 [Desulfamplus sp.]|nr:hypothetical protein [Desulfamplus sp.]
MDNFLRLIANINHLPIYNSPNLLYELDNKNQIFSIQGKSYNVRCGEWLFYPGMLFGSCDKWWADWGQRYTPHEGLDITFYRKKTYNITSRNFDICSFDSNIVVPAMGDGIVLNICKDFLGQSVIIKPSFFSNNKSDNSIRDSKSIFDIEKSIIAVIYSHILTACGLTIGDTVTKGQIIGKVADTSMRKSGITPHLHVSCAEISTKMPLHELNWNIFGNPACASVKFFDPMRI